MNTSQHINNQTTDCTHQLWLLRLQWLH